jgi:hypothetical protein
MNLPKRIKRAEDELRFRMWARFKRILDCCTEQELEFFQATCSLPEEPPPGTSHFDQMDRVDLVKLWRNDEQLWLGHNQEEMAFLGVHGHWPNQACRRDCGRIENREGGRIENRELNRNGDQSR